MAVSGMADATKRIVSIIVIEIKDTLANVISVQTGDASCYFSYPRVAQTQQ